MRAITLTLLFLLAGCGKKDATTEGGNAGPPEGKGASGTEKPPVAVVVDLQVLSEAFRANEAAADEKYTGRRVTCDASMLKLEKLSSGNYMMSFEIFVDGFNFRKADVYAYFPASEVSKLTPLGYRSPVRFSGRCNGREAKAIPPFVAIRDCRIEPLKP